MTNTFEIVPIPGREVVQRNFARLPEKSDTYSNRTLSLNERFSIIERGYHLKPTEQKSEAEKPRIVKMKPIVPFATAEDIVSEMRTTLDEKKTNKDSHSNHGTPKSSPTASSKSKNN